MNLKIPSMVLSVVLVLLSSCGSADRNRSKYLDNFEPFQGTRIEFSVENLPKRIHSPFDDRQIYPTGKVVLEDGIALTLVTVYDAVEPLGEVQAELVKGGERTDKITVAISDLGIFQYAILHLPFVKVIDEGLVIEGPDRPDTTTYRIKDGKFVRVQE